MRFDLAIIGGGINGCGIARDAAGRGLSVILIEMGDIAGATSSASTKLIHGGLRYLEHFKFALVREALAEREVLWRMAPHLVRPVRFILPHRKGLRPSWMLQVGLYLYDHLAPRKLLPAAKRIDLRNDKNGNPLRDEFRSGFVYSDCSVDDARLAILNARDAADRGADIRVGTAATALRREQNHWSITTTDNQGRVNSVEASILVNAAGPWVTDVLGLATGRGARVRLVQGSHIVVPRLYERDVSYVLQTPDGRVVFVVPYERDFTLIGTTESDYEGNPASVKATDAECSYLCAAVSQAFRTEITPDDIVWSYAGVRPLYDDGASAARQTTREYVLDLDIVNAPLLTVIGGKITTFRHLAERALERLAPFLPATATGPWTRDSTLPGGDFPFDGRPELERKIGAAHPYLSATMVARLVRLYGTRASQVLFAVESPEDLGRHYGADLYEREVRYLVENEWARTAADIAWRRTKLGLVLTANEMKSLALGIDDIAARMAAQQVP